MLIEQATPKFKHVFFYMHVQMYMQTQSTFSTILSGESRFTFVTSYAHTRVSFLSFVTDYTIYCLSWLSLLTLWKYI